MALKKDILDNFFDKSKNTNSRSNSNSSKAYRYYRPFDEPEEITQNFNPHDNNNQVHSNYEKLEDSKSYNILNQDKDYIERTTTEEIKQTEDKLETNRGQIEDELDINWRQTEDKPRTNRRQIEDKFGYNSHESLTINSIIGLQKRLLKYVFDCCKIHRSDISPPISLENFNNSISSPISSVKKSLQRLEQKGFLIRKEFKAGRGGWTRYSIPNTIFQEILYLDEVNRLEINSQLYKDKTNININPSENEFEIEKRKSSSNLDQSWFNIDISCLSEIGFTQNHLIQIARKGVLKDFQVKDSIEAFAFDLKVNGKERTLKKDPLSVIMGILKSGQIYNPPYNYEDPATKSLRLRLERLKIEEEKKMKIKVEIFECEFNSWYENIDEVEVKNIFNDQGAMGLSYYGKNDQTSKVILKEYFKTNIFKEDQLHN